MTTSRLDVPLRDGTFLRRDALDQGYTDQMLAAALRQGVVRRVRHGTYAYAVDWDRLDQRQQHLHRASAAVRTAKSEVVLSHVSAAAAWDAPLWELPIDEVHVTRTDQRAGRREPDLVQHRGHLAARDVTVLGHRRLTTPTRTALDLTTVVDVEHALPVLDHLLRVGLTTPELLGGNLALMNHWPNSLATELALRLADGGAESVGESRSRYMFWRGGLPAPILQFPVLDSQERLVAKTDFAWPAYKLFVEFDGRVKYQELLRPGDDVTAVVLREKRREELICRLTGWRCLRIVWADLYRPEQTVALIREFLARGAAPGQAA